MAGVKSVERAVRILGAFDRLNRIMTVRGIAVKTGIARSTVHDICSTLVHEGFLEKRSEGGYQLGIRLATLGGQVIERQGVVDASQKPIQRHIDRYGVEVHVSLYLPGSVFYAYRKRAVTRVATLNRTGRQWAIHESASGRAILAALPPATRERELSPLVSKEQLGKLEKELEECSRNGFLVTDVSQRGFRSIAAPIIDATGLPIGAIGVADLAKVMTPQRVHEIGVAVRSAAEETSQALGWRGTL